MPAMQIRDFIAQYVANIDHLPELLAKPSDEPINLTSKLKLDIDKKSLLITIKNLGA
jgi:hypothetical protein